MANETNLICPKCDKKYHSDDLKLLKCKECRAWLDWDKNWVPPTSEVVEIGNSEVLDRESVSHYEGLNKDTMALVHASNRTTYAVRAIGLWLFTTINTFIIANNLANLAARSAARCKDYYGDCGASAWDSFAGVVLFVGLSLGVYLGVKELNKSVVPK